MSTPSAPGSRRGLRLSLLLLLLAGIGGGAWEVRLRKIRQLASAELAEQVNSQTEANIRSRDSLAELRAQVAFWEREAAGDTRQPTESAREAEIRRWINQLTRLRQHFRDHPEEAIPEMDLLDETEWLYLARESKLDDPVDLRRALAQIRFTGRSLFNEKLNRALNAYLSEHDDTFPDTLAAVASYLPPELDPASLSRYRILLSGKASEANGLIRFTEIEPPIDEPYELRAFSAGDRGMATSWTTGELMLARQEARLAYLKVHDGGSPSGDSDILPYVTSAAHRDYLAAADRFAGANEGRRPSKLEDVQPYLETPEGREFAGKLFQPR